MKTVKVTFSNKDTITTPINGTDQEIKNYYYNNVFNLGSGDGPDIMVKAVNVEILKDKII